MEIWREGTSRSVLNNTSAYGPVLFRCGNTLSGVTLTNSQQSSVPSNTGLAFSNQISKTAAGTLAAGTVVNDTYFIEGYDVQKMMLDETSLIFWVKSSVSGNRSVAITNTGNTHSFIQQYNIAQANVWQLVVLQLPALSTCPGTINRTNGVGLEIKFNIVAGSTYQTSTLNSWQSGLFLSGIGEDTTWLTGTTHDFSITGVMVLPGDWSALETNTSIYRFLRSGRNFQEEVSATERYYEAGAFRFRAALTSGSIEGAIFFSSEKRITPIITEDGPTETANNIHTKGFSVNSSSAAFTINWSADARF
jgi:hypothetical protein